MVGLEGWRVITDKFNEKFPVAHFSKKQEQEKEKELKTNYKALRDAKRDSGNGWNESLCMILTEPRVWEKLIANHPKVAKFRKKPFPLFYQLEALYEGEEEGGSGRKRKQSHIGSALEGYVEYKKSQTNKTLQAFEERKRSEKEFSVEKCVDQVVSMVELTDK
uniref:Myb/SANT-like domain-containing protein n=1 Tax=Setaria italica TaxID=4555 RepID=K3ZAC5_SETIT